jgi:hypothetical protein
MVWIWGATEVATEAGVSKGRGSVRHYFLDREQMLLLAIDRASQRLHCRFQMPRSPTALFSLGPASCAISAGSLCAVGPAWVQGLVAADGEQVGGGEVGLDELAGDVGQAQVVIAGVAA